MKNNLNSYFPDGKTSRSLGSCFTCSGRWFPPSASPAPPGGSSEHMLLWAPGWGPGTYFHHQQPKRGKSGPSPHPQKCRGAPVSAAQPGRRLKGWQHQTTLPSPTAEAARKPKCQLEGPRATHEGLHNLGL